MSIALYCTKNTFYCKQYVIVKSHYEEVIIVITQVQGGAEDKCNNNDNLRVQWDLTGFHPIVFDVRHSYTISDC